MSECTQDLRKAGKPYLHTCAECGLGPCKRYLSHGNAYTADENYVYYHPYGNTPRELFLTVHPTKDCTKTTVEQARVIAHMLNSDASFKYRILG